MLYRRLVLTVGPGFALGAGLAAYFAHRPPLHVLAWAIIGGLAQAGLAALLASGLMRVAPGRWPVVILHHVLQIGGAVASALALLAAINFWPDARGRWKQLPPSPEVPARLETPICVYSGAPWVIAISETGRRYRLTGSSPQDAWVPTSAPAPEAGLRTCRSTQADATWLPRPRLPSGVRETHLVLLEGADCGGQAAYALASDGAVWAWEVFECSLGVVGIVFLTLGWSALLGLGGAVVALRTPLGRHWTSRNSIPVA